MLIRRNTVIQLLQTRRCDHFGVVDGQDIWLTPDTTIIRLPLNGDVPFAVVEVICLEILDLPMWEFDFFLGESGI